MPTLPIETPVTEFRAAPTATARQYFAKLLSLETDCWDVHAEMATDAPSFVLLDVRSPKEYEGGHLPGAVNLPHRLISERTLAGFDDDTVFVVYCDGPHCNGADRAGLRLASLGRPVKKMIGGVEGWKDEGFELVSA